MYDLEQIREFVRTTGLKLFGPLDLGAVNAFATKWAPEVRFHDAELFHSMSLSQYLEVVRSAPYQEEHWFALADASGAYVPTRPPVVRYGGELAGEAARRAFAARGGGTQGEAAAAFAANAVGSTSLQADQIGLTSTFRVIKEDSHDIARELFGSNRSAPSGVRLPRHDQIGIVAEVRFLLESFALWLIAHDSANQGRFPREGNKLLDAVLGVWDFDLPADLSPFLHPEGMAGPSLTDRLATGQLDAPGVLSGLSGAIESSGIMDPSAWDAIRSHVFLEFYLVYTFNNKRDHVAAFIRPFVACHDHDGDIESCALVFERSALSPATVHSAIPKYIIATAHAESTGIDSIRELDPADLTPTMPGQIPVYVAAGSHATYLSAGKHTTIPKLDFFTDPGVVTALFLQAAAIHPAVAILVVILLWLVACVDDTLDDQTNDNGVSARVGRTPRPPGAQGERHLSLSVEVTPLASGTNIYTSPSDTHPVELEERIFPGEWGGAARFADKPGRFLRKLVWHKTVVVRP